MVTSTPFIVAPAAREKTALVGFSTILVPCLVGSQALRGTVFVVIYELWFPLSYVTRHYSFFSVHCSLFTIPPLPVSSNYVILVVKY